MIRSLASSLVLLTAIAPLIPAMGAAAAQPAHSDPAPVRTGTARGSHEPGPLGLRIAAATPGSTIVVEPGIYREHLYIDRPLTLVGGGRAVIDGGGSGDIVEITAPDVTLRGLVIRNTGIDLDRENAAIRVLAPRVTLENNVLEDILFGIDLREAPDGRIVGNSIGGKNLDIARRGDGLRLWRSDRTIVEGNTIHDGRDAILWYSSGVVVRNNRGFDCRYGLHLMFSDRVSIIDNEFTGNSVGIYLMYSTGIELLRNRLIRNRGPSGYGIGLKEADQFTVRDNLILGNRAGVYLDGSPFTRVTPGEFTGNTLAFNDIGFLFLPSARGNVLSGNNFIDNIDQVAVAGRGSLEHNRFWKDDRGNFWSDYTGYDRNGDGIGDFVHESQTLFESLMDREPSLRLFLFSPAQQAVEFVGRAIPAVRPEPKFCDEVPLMRPVPTAVHASSLGADFRRTLAAGGAGMVLTGASLIIGCRPRIPRRKRRSAPAGRRTAGGRA